MVYDTVAGWNGRSSEAPLAVMSVQKLLRHCARQRQAIEPTLWPQTPQSQDALARLFSSAQASFNLGELLIQLLLPDHQGAPDRLPHDLHTSLHNLRVLLDATWPAEQPMPTLVEYVQPVRLATRAASVLLDCALWLVTTALMGGHIGAIDVYLYPLASQEVVLEVRMDAALYPAGSCLEAGMRALLAGRLAPLGGVIDDGPAPAWLMGWDTGEGEVPPWNMLLRVPRLVA